MLALVVATAVSFASLPPAQQKALVAEARKLDGVRWVMGGRLGKNGVQDIDCQGLVFFALQSISRCGWRSWSVMPTTSVKGELGLPVAGLAPIASKDLAAAVDDTSAAAGGGAHLEPGDVIWFLDPTPNPAEPALTKLDGGDVWVWHTALYTGGGNFISADPYDGKVVEEPLLPYAQKYYAGLFVTRMNEGPRPPVCKPWAPMTRR